MSDHTPIPICSVCCDGSSPLSLLATGCPCSGTMNPYAHAACLARLSGAKEEALEERKISFDEAWLCCFACKKNYGKDTVELAQKAYELYDDEGSSVVLRIDALLCYAAVLSCPDAISLLQRFPDLCRELADDDKFENSYVSSKYMDAIRLLQRHAASTMWGERETSRQILLNQCVTGLAATLGRTRRGTSEDADEDSNEDMWSMLGNPYVQSMLRASYNDVALSVTQTDGGLPELPESKSVTEWFMLADKYVDTHDWDKAREILEPLLVYCEEGSRDPVGKCVIRGIIEMLVKALLQSGDLEAGLAMTRHFYDTE